MKILYAIIGLSFLSIGSTAATFSSFTSGPWNVPGTWLITGFDADGIPDTDDDVTINSGHTVNLASLSDCRALTVSTGGTLAYSGFQLRLRGNFTRQGSTTGTASLYFFGSNTTIDITGQYTNAGNWTFQTGCNAVITSTTNINKINYFYIQSGASLINNGSVTLIGGAVQTNGTGTFTNGSNAFLGVARNFAGTGFNFSASGNTVRYNSSFTNTIVRTTYHNLELMNTTGTKSWSGGALTVNGNLTITAGTTFNWANQDINLGGNWTNGSVTCTNMGTINFTGAGTQTITRGSSTTETFTAVTLNGSGTVLLNDSLLINTNLTINSGTLDVSAGNFTIRLHGNMEDNSSFNARNGTVFLTGTSPQNIGGFGSTRFFNLTSSNPTSISIDFTKEIGGLLRVTSGSFGPSGFGSVVMVATAATSYGRIAPLGAGATLTGGSWAVQSFVNGPATAFWQYLSTPMSGNLLQDWDGDTRFFMSGVGGNDGNACCPIFRSVRLYNEPTNTYTNVTTVSHALQRGRGYMLWMADNLNSLTAPLVYDSRGIPSFGAVSIGVTAGGAGAGYNILGNPYACPINFANLVASNGGLLSPNFLILQENGTYATNPNGGVIGSNQGFMVLANTSGTVNFAEAHKNTTAIPALIRTAQEENQIIINVSNEVSGRGEQTVIQFREDATFGRDADLDLPYIQSPYEDASRIFTTDGYGNQYIFNNIHAYDEEVAVPLTVVASAPGVQKISFQNLNRMFAYNCAYLEDTHTGTITWLNDNDVYNFESAVGEERQFVLHFSRKSDCQLPLSHVQSSLDASSQAFMSAEMIKVMFNFEETQEVVVSVFDITGKEIITPTRHLVTGETLNIGTVNTHGIYLIRIVKGTEVVTKKLYY